MPYIMPPRIYLSCSVTTLLDGATVLIIMTVVKKTLVVTRCTWFTFSPPFNFYDASVTRLTLQSGYLSGTILAWLGSYLYPWMRICRPRWSQAQRGPSGRQKCSWRWRGRSYGRRFPEGAGIGKRCSTTTSTPVSQKSSASFGAGRDLGSGFNIRA